jgi:hypothetical protein
LALGSLGCNRNTHESRQSVTRMATSHSDRAGNCVAFSSCHAHVFIVAPCCCRTGSCYITACFYSMQACGIMSSLTSARYPVQ